jgi:hypothetical protein
MPVTAWKMDRRDPPHFEGASPSTVPGDAYEATEPLAVGEAVPTRPEGSGANERVRLGPYLALIAAGSLLATVGVVSTQTMVAEGGIGIDYAYYRDVGARWLTDGSYYSTYQLAGPYDIQLMAEVLYPPSALLLFVPAAILPWPFWWIVPIGVTLYVVAGLRPSALGVAGMLLLLAWPRAMGAFLFGNTDMWVMAGVAGGLRWGWPALLVSLKPTFAPLALLGIRRRSWWLAAVAMTVFVVATLPMWRDYATAMFNIRASPDYSLGSLPLILVPLVAWWTSHSRRPAITASGR